MWLDKYLSNVCMAKVRNLHKEIVFVTLLAFTSAVSTEHSIRALYNLTLISSILSAFCSLNMLSFSSMVPNTQQVRPQCLLNYPRDMLQGLFTFFPSLMICLSFGPAWPPSPDLLRSHGHGCLYEAISVPPKHSKSGLDVWLPAPCS